MQYLRILYSNVSPGLWYSLYFAHADDEDAAAAAVVECLPCGIPDNYSDSFDVDRSSFHLRLPDLT
jgi:hypothetical protein